MRLVLLKYYFHYENSKFFRPDARPSSCGQVPRLLNLFSDNCMYVFVSLSAHAHTCTAKGCMLKYRSHTLNICFMPNFKYLFSDFKSMSSLSIRLNGCCDDQQQQFGLAGYQKLHILLY